MVLELTLLRTSFAVYFMIRFMCSFIFLSNVQNTFYALNVLKDIKVHILFYFNIWLELPTECLQTFTINFQQVGCINKNRIFDTIKIFTFSLHYIFQHSIFMKCRSFWQNCCTVSIIRKDHAFGKEEW